MGKTATRIITQMQATVKELEASSNDDCKAIGKELGKAVGALGEASMWLGGNAMKDLKGAFAGAVPYTMLWGFVAGGWQMGRAALIAEKKLDDDFYKAKVVTARYYADHVLPKAIGLKHEITAGGKSTLALDERQFDLDRASLALV
jgi:hypothetical protein